jgi:hypothetical protein
MQPSLSIHMHSIFRSPPLFSIFIPQNRLHITISESIPAQDQNHPPFPFLENHTQSSIVMQCPNHEMWCRARVL